MQASEQHSSPARDRSPERRPAASPPPEGHLQQDMETAELKALDPRSLREATIIALKFLNFATCREIADFVVRKHLWDARCHSSLVSSVIYQDSKLCAGVKPLQERLFLCQRDDRLEMRVVSLTRKGEACYEGIRDRDSPAPPVALPQEEPAEIALPQEEEEPVVETVEQRIAEVENMRPRSLREATIVALQFLGVASYNEIVNFINQRRLLAPACTVHQARCVVGQDRFVSRHSRTPTHRQFRKRLDSLKPEQFRRMDDGAAGSIEKYTLTEDGEACYQGLLQQRKAAIVVD